MNGKAFIPICSTAAAALVALSAVTSGQAEPSRMQHPFSNSVTFPVSPPADPNAPNIASVVVSNDDTGLLTFRVEIPNRPVLLADMNIGILLDTDQNASTGDLCFLFGHRYGATLRLVGIEVRRCERCDRAARLP